jgi:hypothetical protein
MYGVLVILGLTITKAKVLGEQMVVVGSYSSVVGCSSNVNNKYQITQERQKGQGKMYPANDS